MKRLIIGSISLLLLGTAAMPAAQAQSQPTQSSPDSVQQNQMDQDSLEDSNQNQRATPYQDGSPGSVENQQNDSSQDNFQPAAGESNQNTFAATGNFVSQYEPTPFEIVSLARQGYLQNQGIPSYATLTHRFRARNITPEDIVQAAVNAGRLPASRMDDTGYIYGVRYQLIGLDRNFRD